MPKIHHLGFVVKNLDASVDRYSRLLGMLPTSRDTLDERGVVTARFNLGGIWLVLIQPVQKNSEPGRYLAEHGEGFFMLSLCSDGLEETDRALSARDLSLDWSTLRQGLDNWRVADLKNWRDFGAVVQFAEDP